MQAVGKGDGGGDNKGGEENQGGVVGDGGERAGDEPEQAIEDDENVYECDAEWRRPGRVRRYVDASLTALVPLFLPGVILWSVLGFLTFSVVSFRTTVYSNTVSVLLLLPPAFVILNLLTAIIGIESATTTLAIAIADTLAMLAIGRTLRRVVPTDQPETESPSDLGA